jgi:hypothetical protein
MITVQRAEELARAGVQWEPRRGDHFVLPHRDMDEQVFVLSDMTIEVHQFPAGEVLGFNGTVEWALDSVERHEALWIPREDQLRELLGDAFAALRRTADGYVCDLADGSATTSTTPDDAYALGVLHVLGRHRAVAPAIR